MKPKFEYQLYLYILSLTLKWKIMYKVILIEIYTIYMYI